MTTIKTLSQSTKTQISSCPVWPLPSLNDQKPVLLVQECRWPSASDRI